MKKIILLLGCLLLMSGTNTEAQSGAPQGFNFQAVIRNNAGNILANQSITLRLSIVDGQGTTDYRETHSGTTDNFGLISVPVGQGTPVYGTFNSVEWSEGNYDMKVEVNTGSGYVEMGESDLLSVPYSLFTQEAGIAINMVLSDLTNVSSTAPANGQVLKWNGSSWAPAADNNTTYTAGNGISISSNTITNTGILSGTTASGDLSGSYPGPTVAKIRGKTVTTATPVAGDLLQFNGTSWDYVQKPVFKTAFASGAGNNPTQGSISNVVSFASPYASLSLTPGTWTILVWGNKALGTTVSTGASGMNIGIAYKLSTGTNFIFIGTAVTDLQVVENEKVIFSSTSRITTTVTTTATYHFGLVAWAANTAFWNNNGGGTVTVWAILE